MCCSSGVHRLLGMKPQLLISLCHPGSKLPSMEIPCVPKQGSLPRRSTLWTTVPFLTHWRTLSSGPWGAGTTPVFCAQARRKSQGSWCDTGQKQGSADHWEAAGRSGSISMEVHTVQRPRLWLSHGFRMIKCHTVPNWVRNNADYRLWHLHCAACVPVFETTGHSESLVISTPQPHKGLHKLLGVWGPVTIWLKSVWFPLGQMSSLPALLCPGVN